MNEPFDDQDSPERDPLADETLDRAVARLRTQEAPPLPADLFASAADSAKVALPAAPGSYRRISRWSVALAASVVAVAALGVGLLLNRFGNVEPMGRPPVAVDVPDVTPRVDTATREIVAPHPRLAILAERSATLKDRVRALRARAEAAAARQQADRLLMQYARR